MSITSGPTSIRTDDLIIVSVDDHLVEPPDMFERPAARRGTPTAPRG